MVKQLSLSAAILLLQTPGQTDDAKARRTQGLAAYREICNFPVETKLEDVLSHLKDVYGVTPGKQHLKARSFRNTRNAQRGRMLVRNDGQVLFMRRWWSAVGLQQFGIYECSAEVERLGPEVSPEFGDPANYKGVFTTSRTRGKKLGKFI